MPYTYNEEDAKKNDEYEPIPEGDYECFIEDIVKGENNNAKYLRVQLRLRDDVEQECKNRVLSDFIRMDDTGKYNPKKINKILSTQKDIKNGQVFETIEDVINFLKGQYLIVHIKINEWQGKKTNNVYFYKPTEHPANTLGGDSKVTEEDIVNDDMPF